MIAYKMRLAHLRDSLVGQCVGEGLKAPLKSKSKVLGIPQKHSILLFHCELTVLWS